MKSKVYFIPVNDNVSAQMQAEAVKKLWDVCGAGSCVASDDFTAIKVHVGEKGNVTRLDSELAAVAVREAKSRGAKVFLTETATLYKGERDNAVNHIFLAAEHGFSIAKTGAPFILADGLTGAYEAEVKIPGELSTSVKIAAELMNVDSLIVISHATGHLVTGFGAAVKNIGMGLASRKGKLRQHSAMKPQVDPSNCVLCRRCIKWCPEQAISEKEQKAFIDSVKCVGCGECLTQCRFDAIRFDWGAESEYTQKMMAEHALGVTIGKKDKIMFFNVLVNMTAECDCFGEPQKKILPDMGILASTDPVAIDKAALDLTGLAAAASKHSINQHYDSLDPLVQLRHGEKIGLGSMDYELIKI